MFFDVFEHTRREEREDKPEEILGLIFPGISSRSSRLRGSLSPDAVSRPWPAAWQSADHPATNASDTEHVNLCEPENTW
jgi:hypothetical protein